MSPTRGVGEFTSGGLCTRSGLEGCRAEIADRRGFTGGSVSPPAQHERSLLASVGQQRGRLPEGPVEVIYVNI